MSCCPTDLKPVASNYERKGMTSYLTGLDTASGRSKESAILLIPDIFSFHPNGYQVADTLAEAGFTVLFPNFFGESAGWPRGTPIDVNSSEWKAFYADHVTQFNRHLTTVASSVSLLKALGATKIGTIAMCWGSKVGVLAANKWPDMFSTIVLPHPSFLTEEDGKGFAMPTLIMSSSGEDEKVMEAVAANTKQGNAASAHMRLAGLHHGFMGARGYLPGSLSQMPEDYMKASEKALHDMVGYFKENLQ